VNFLIKKMPKTLCAVCDNDDFDNVDGFYYCNVCGTKNEVRISIGFEQ
jgi:hypothetical protein